MVSVDKDIELMYVVDSNQTISRQNLQVKVSATYNRRKLPCIYEDGVDDIWNRRLQKNPKLWNGTKFRLHSIDNIDGVTTFNIGISCYKDFIGTNWSPNIGTLKNIGVTRQGNPQAYLSDALGVGALVITTDNKMILMRRSQHCGEAVGLLDIPGGHPEPMKLVGKFPMEEIDLDTMEPAAVVTEIFDSTREEIVNEVNIPASCLTDPILLGVALNTTSGGRPSSEYLVNCSLSSEEVEKLYKTCTQCEAEETTSIHFIDMDLIPTLQSHADIWTDMAPSAKGCVLLYQDRTP